MNNQRRKVLDNIKSKLAELLEELESVQGEEQEAYDNMPENLQYSERGERAEEACSNLDSAVDSINEAMDYIDTAVE